MSVVIDLVLFGLFLFFLIQFSKYGFARTVYKIGKTWLSMFCSAILGPWVADKVADLFLRDSITDGIYSTLFGLVEANANDYNLGQLFASLPPAFVRFLEGLDINFASLEAEYGTTTHASEDIVYAISQRIAVPCIDVISSLIGHVICFVVPLVFFVWLHFEIRKHRLAFFRYVDRGVGIVMGLTIGYCAAWGLAFVLRTIFQVVVCFDAHSGVTAVYESTYVMRFLNEFHVMDFLKQIVSTLIEMLPF